MERARTFFTRQCLTSRPSRTPAKYAEPLSIVNLIIAIILILRTLVLRFAAVLQVKHVRDIVLF